MSNTWRRFEVLLPLEFNDGSPVPAQWLNEAVREIVEYFGAVTYETQRVEGLWHHEEMLYRDTLVRIVADVPDSTKSRRWMKEFKKRWRAKLKQLELWMVSHRIDVE
jgi:hypothetical protein